MSACELGASQALKGSAQRCPAPSPRLQAPGSEADGNCQPEQCQEGMWWGGSGVWPGFVW